MISYPSLRRLRRGTCRTWATIVLLAGLVACARAPVPGASEHEAREHGAEQTPGPFLLGGIQVNEAQLEPWLGALEAAGMNTVAVTDYAHQGDWDSANLWWDPNPGLLPEIRAAKDRGLHVVLVLRLALDRAFPRNRFLWHGMIMPASDEQLRRWFARYQTFVRAWAEVAEREGIDALMIGSELNALTSTVPVATVPALEDWLLDDAKQRQRRARAVAAAHRVPAEHLWQNSEQPLTDVGSYLDARIAAERAWAHAQTSGTPEQAVARLNARRAALERHWLALIDCVRGIYHGRLGYAANFDQYQEVSFWDRLDVIGINAYFKLRDYLVPEGDRQALAFALDQGWRRVLGEIDAFRALWGLEQPLMFTEMGFTPRRNSTIETWADSGFGAVRRSLRSDPDDTELVVWREQPVDLEERTLAVAALEKVRRELAFPLDGILWWKLSSHAYHRKNESFLLLIGQEHEDPLLSVLRRFNDRTP